MATSEIKEQPHVIKSGSALNFGDLRFMYISAACGNAQQVDIPINGFAETPFAVIPYCTQNGFGACMTVSVINATQSKVTLYQYNNANVGSSVGAIVIGRKQ
jgi:hypothetical protein